MPICAIWSAVRPVAPDPPSTAWPLSGGACQPAGWEDCLPCSARPAHAGCDRQVVSLTALSARNRLPAFLAFSTSPPASGAISRRSMSGSRRAVAWRSAMALPAPGRSRAVPCRPMPTDADQTFPREQHEAEENQQDRNSRFSVHIDRYSRKKTQNSTQSVEPRKPRILPGLNLAGRATRPGGGGSTAPGLAVWRRDWPKAIASSRQQQSRQRHRRNKCAVVQGNIRWSCDGSLGSIYCQPQ